MSIALVTASATDGCAVYRSVGPFHHLPFTHTVYRGQEGYAIWHAILQHPILFIQRPWALPHLDLLHTAKALGRKIIIDWDDDLTQVPEWNPNHLAFKDHHVPELAHLADLIFVSTDHLRNAIYPHNTNTHVIPNAIDPVFLNLPKLKRTRSIAWRGSPTHIRDLEHARPILQHYSTTHQVFFFGDAPKHFAVPNSTALPFQDYAQYMVTLNYIAPEFVIGALEDCPFNHSKSDILAQEAYAVGAQFVHNNTAAYANLPRTATPRLLTDPECNPKRERLISALL